jgi:hypothetical protein
MDKTSEDYLGPLSGTPQARTAPPQQQQHAAAWADGGETFCMPSPRALACVCVRARAQAVVDAALDFAGVTSDDVLYDLGCNDGACARTHSARNAQCPASARGPSARTRVRALHADAADAAIAVAGRVCIAAASRCGARCVGVELDATAVARANAAVQAGTPLPPSRNARALIPTR